MPKIETQNLIPGHVYQTQTGTELVYLGYGTYRRYAKNTHDYDWGYPKPKYLYMKKNDILTKIADGRMSQDLSCYDGSAGGRKGAVPDFFKTVFFCNKPRTVIEDLGELFPAEMFKHWKIMDTTTDVTVYWSVNTADFRSTTNHL